MTKRNFKQSAPEGTHYFASSVAEWRTGSSLGDIVPIMMTGGMSFNVFLVHAPEDTNYEINAFEPQGVEKTYIGYYEVQP